MKNFFRILMIPLFIGAIVIMGTGFAPFDPAVGMGNFDGTSGCKLLDAYHGQIDATSESISPPEANKSGHYIVRCTADGVDNPTGNLITMYGGGENGTCFALGMPTEDWQEFITPSGRAMLMCRFPERGN